MNSRKLRTAVLRAALANAEALSRVEVLATGLRVATRVEAAAGAEREVWRRRLAHATAGTTLTQRRQHDERNLRRRLAPDRPTHGPGVPEVFWHSGGPPPAMLHTPGAPVVVLLNGWTASGLSWPSALVTRLQRQFHVIRVDNRGAGYSRTAPAPFTIAQMADDVAGVLAFLGVPTAVVAGLSMGGMIAQEVAMRHPARVQRLVLMGTRPPAPASFQPSRSVTDALFAPPPNSGGRGEFLRRMWAPMFGPGFAETHPAELAELLAQVRERPTPRDGVLDQMRAMASWYGSDRLRSISAPTTVLHGTADPLIPIGNAMRLAQLIPGARYVELPGVGHIVPVEALDTVAEIIERA